MTAATEGELPRSGVTGAKVIYCALQALRDNGGSMRSRDVIDAVQKRASLDGWETHQYERTGKIRWQSILHFYSIRCVKAGFLVKKKGIWYLTPEGEQAINLGKEGLREATLQAYRKWRRENPKEVPVSDPTEAVDEEASDSVDLENIEQQGVDSLKAYIDGKNPYEFQDLVAALLRGMGYHTPVVAPPGKDGGVDIVAYRDPLGTVSPRVKVQVKHRKDSARVDEIRQLMGLLQKDGDVGMFVSSGGFTPDAVSTARGSHVHVELIDLDRLIDLWQNC
jgi:restriction system protein